MATLFFLTGRAWTDANGNPYPAATALFTTVADVNQDTYTTAGESVANANPVVSDASTGIFPDIYLAAKRYKAVIKDASGNTLFTYDVIDGQKVRVYSSAEPSPTFQGMEWVDTDTNDLWERNVANDGWNSRGDADAAINAASVTEQLAATSTSKASTPDSVGAIWQRGANISPSGGVVSLPSGGGGVFNVAAGNFSSISSAVGGRTVIFVFGGTSVITHNGTSLILPGGASLTSEAGDCAMFVNEAATDASGSNWRCVWYQRDSTTLAAPINYAATKAEMEAFSSALRWVTPAIQHNHPGHPKAWVNFTTRGTNGACTINASYNVDSVTRSASGIYLVVFTTDFSSVNYAVSAISKAAIGSNLLTTYDNPAAGQCEIIQQSASAGTATNTGDITAVFLGDQ